MPEPPPLFPFPRQFESGGAGPAAEAEPEAEPDSSLPEQGYELTAGAGGIRIRHADEAGLRYARSTLAQLRAASPGGLPGLRVRDWPDFPLRGYMLDVSRDRVPTRATLGRLVALLERLRFNHLQLYVEHSFAYRRHLTVWKDASPLTAEDLRWLDGLCAEAGIELTANQNCFGHMARWLTHDGYRARAEAPDGWQAFGGRRLGPATLAPTPENAEFALDLCREQLESLRSRRINIGCDETFELGRGRSAEAVAERGRGRVYLEHLLRLLNGLHEDGCEVLFWGDIVRSHPELIGELPRERTVALAWHYEAPNDSPEARALIEPLADFGIDTEILRGFEAQVAPFAQADRPFWVCPGSSGWNSFVGRLSNARANIDDAVSAGLAAGARGFLLTDWGDNGHLQPPSVSFAPLALAAGLTWCAAANRDRPLAETLDAHVFQDPEAQLGAALEALGDVYRQTGRLAFNASPVFAELVPEAALAIHGEVSEPATRAALEAIDEASTRIARARPACSDAEAVTRELAQAARLARHGVWRLRRRAGFTAPEPAPLQIDLREAIEEQRACWLARSRPGGLEDSLTRLHRALTRYTES
ncbi:MAG: glycoside hydrolase [Proteobacteria bacterium]|nr:glycoside hydrolase [Pseudomonadota bacterium]